MKTIYVLYIITLAVTASVFSCRIETDGCSSPVKNAPFINVLTPACVRHDVCYRCVSMTDINFFNWKKLKTEIFQPKPRVLNLLVSLEIGRVQINTLSSFRNRIKEYQLVKPIAILHERKFF